MLWLGIAMGFALGMLAGLSFGVAGVAINRRAAEALDRLGRQACVVVVREPAPTLRVLYPDAEAMSN